MPTPNQPPPPSPVGAPRPGPSPSTAPVPTPGVEAADGPRFGGGWYPVESFGGLTFRWSSGQSDIVIPGTVPGASVALDLEPGPAGGGKPLKLTLADGSTTTQLADLAGRTRLVLPALAGGSTIADRRVELRAQQLTTAASGSEQRVLAFRVFRLDWQGSGAFYDGSVLRTLTDVADITPAASRAAIEAGGPGGALPADGLFVGYGWYPMETAGADTFRWASNDVEIVVTAPTGSRGRLLVDGEPGPGVGLKPVTVTVLDRLGQTVASLPYQGRQPLEIVLPIQAGPTVAYRLRLEGGGQTTPGDTRVLNFRVFRIAWVS
ncbi:MAG: hypothetical protein HYX52_09470 [Chloroflexi bacterium]|nr:hypothetical protein [Chloroflexota bacterium]